MAITVPTDAYCTVAEAQALLGSGRTISASTTPTLTAFETWIKAGAQILNDTLRTQGIAVPVTDTASLARLSTANAQYAAGMYEMAVQNTQNGQVAGTAGHLYLELFETEIKRLQKRGTGLGAVGTPAGMGPAGNTDLQPGGDDEDQAFTYGMRF